MEPKMTPKDFFLQIGAMAALYVGTFSLINLLFLVIDEAFPDPALGQYWGSPEISWPIAALIVLFPIYVLLMWLLSRESAANPRKKDLAIRRWLVFITLFIAGVVIVGDLITVLYYFLDGRILTVSFIFKVFTVLLVAALIFAYYLLDLRDRLGKSGNRVFAAIGLIIILGSIIVGFAVIGSPMTQRAKRLDNQRLNDLQNIQWQIVNYWQQKGILPATLADLADPIANFTAPVDPETGQIYEYLAKPPRQFELCATFALAGNSRLSDRYSTPRPIINSKVSFDNWQHDASRHCFSRTIDPDFYPVRPKTIL
jgi:hypothetical protein